MIKRIFLLTIFCVFSSIFILSKETRAFCSGGANEKNWHCEVIGYDHYGRPYYGCNGARWLGCWQHDPESMACLTGNCCARFCGHKENCHLSDRVGGHYYSCSNGAVEDSVGCGGQEGGDTPAGCGWTDPTVPECPGTCCSPDTCQSYLNDSEGDEACIEGTLCCASCGSSNMGGGCTFSACGKEGCSPCAKYHYPGCPDGFIGCSKDGDCKGKFRWKAFKDLNCNGIRDPGEGWIYKAKHDCGYPESEAVCPGDGCEISWDGSGPGADDDSKDEFNDKCTGDKGDKNRIPFMQRKVCPGNYSTTFHAPSGWKDATVNNVIINTGSQTWVTFAVEPEGGCPYILGRVADSRGRYWRSGDCSTPPCPGNNCQSSSSLAITCNSRLNSWGCNANGAYHLNNGPFSEGTAVDCTASGLSGDSDSENHYFSSWGLSQGGGQTTGDCTDLDSCVASFTIDQGVMGGGDNHLWFYLRAKPINELIAISGQVNDQLNNTDIVTDLDTDGDGVVQVIATFSDEDPWNSPKLSDITTAVVIFDEYKNGGVGEYLDGEFYRVKYTDDGAGSRTIEEEASPYGSSKINYLNISPGSATSLDSGGTTTLTIPFDLDYSNLPADQYFETHLYLRAWDFNDASSLKEWMAGPITFWNGRVSVSEGNSRL